MIFDQDDIGVWICQKWLEIFYICVVYGWNQYVFVGWLGIFGDFFGDGGLDLCIVKKEWLKEYIQIGLFGVEYFDVEYVMEGDILIFFYYIQNGLGFLENFIWGFWGGWFIFVNVSLKGIF